MSGKSNQLAKLRCAWAGQDPLLISYHDEQWGVPVHDDRLLFEMLNLEGAQAGLNWLTILKKRSGYVKAFANFQAARVARYDAAKKLALMRDAGIIRNRLKIDAAVENAKAFLEVRRECGSFDAFIWKFVNQRPLTNPAPDKGVTMSAEMSRELKRRGFRFVGPTICYAFMQAVGMVNDHERTCFRHAVIKKTFGR